MFAFLSVTVELTQTRGSFRTGNSTSYVHACTQMRRWRTVGGIYLPKPLHRTNHSAKVAVLRTKPGMYAHQTS